MKFFHETKRNKYGFISLKRSWVDAALIIGYVAIIIAILIFTR
jgi:hypothetical protein